MKSKFENVAIVRRSRGNEASFPDYIRTRLVRTYVYALADTIECGCIVNVLLRMYQDRVRISQSLGR